MNKDMNKKLDQLLADMPKPKYDLDAWLQEDKTEEFDRLQRTDTDIYLQRTNTELHGILSSMQRSDTELDGSKRKMWRWVAAAACLMIIIGIGVTVKLMYHNPESEPMIVENDAQPHPSLVAENNAQPLPSLVGEGPGVGSVTPTPEAKTTHMKKLQTPPLPPPLEGRGAAARRSQHGRGVAARTLAKQDLPDTLGTGIWQRRENVVRAMQILSECEADIRQEEQQIRNSIVEATFHATPQPKNAILVTTEAGDYEVIETRNIIEI